MARLVAWDVRVGVKQSVCKYADKYVVLDFRNLEPITLDMDDAIQLHRRLGTFLAAHTTAKRRANAVKRRANAVKR